MKYFLDQEFQEGFHKPLFGKRRHFIDLISIGIVCEDGREYSAISREFDLKRVWKDNWLRENVLRPIHERLAAAYIIQVEGKLDKHVYSTLKAEGFTLPGMKMLIRMYGKANEQIAKEIVSFVYPITPLYNHADQKPSQIGDLWGNPEPTFYGYYCDYDWVLFCSLFGRMIDLPKGFPMYCRDLKQMMDDKAKTWDVFQKETTPGERLLMIKDHKLYPKQENEHDALADARWNRDLYNFLNSL